MYDVFHLVEHNIDVLSKVSQYLFSLKYQMEKLHCLDI